VGWPCLDAGTDPVQRNPLVYESSGDKKMRTIKGIGAVLCGSAQPRLIQGHVRGAAVIPDM